MRRKGILLLGLMVASILSLGLWSINLAAGGNQPWEENQTIAGNDTYFPPILNRTLVTLSSDPTLAQFLPLSAQDEQTSKASFERFKFRDGDVVYYRQRVVGNITVEGDFVNYQVVEAKNFTHWRNDLPEAPPSITVTQEEAISIAGGIGERGDATLYYISPDSAIFSSVVESIANVTKEPCWVVCKRDGNNTLYNITVVSTEDGIILGYGIPPPALGYVYLGPGNRTCTQNSSNCSEAELWRDWYESAQYYFGLMGYSYDSAMWATGEDVKNHIQSYETAVFYGMAHGNWWEIDCGCCGYYTSCANPGPGVKEWIADYPPMRFTFLSSCDAMAESDNNRSFSYVFRKGLSIDTVVVGCIGMGQAPLKAWQDSLAWQNFFFTYLANGWTVSDAYTQAGKDFPGTAPYYKFVGDPHLQLARYGHLGVPVISRIMPHNTIAGETRDVNAGLLPGVSIGIYKEGSSLVATGNSNPNFSVMVNETGECWMRASKNAYFTLDTNTLPPHRNPNYPDYITLLGEQYVYDFEGDYGLVPKACTISYAMTSINRWLFWPATHPEWGLSVWKASQSVMSWQNPS